MTTTADRLRVHELDPAGLWLDGADLREALQGSPRRIPSYYGYDQAGSELFDAITRLPEYFLTATEYDLLERHASEIASLAPCEWVVELGSGSARKTSLLLTAFAEHRPTTFLPVDVSREMLLASSERLLKDIPGLAVTGLVGKMESGLDWVGANRTSACLVAFIGSGLGNMLPVERRALLSQISSFCQPGDFFLTSADFQKPAGELERAYNDPPGVDLWSRFRLNRLTRLNALYDGDFALERYYQYCHYDTRDTIIQARVYASEPQRVRLRGLDLSLYLARGESIVVDYSFKFSRPDLVVEFGDFGFEVAGEWINPSRQYGIFLLRKR